MDNVVEYMLRTSDELRWSADGQPAGLSFPEKFRTSSSISEGPSECLLRAFRVASSSFALAVGEAQAGGLGRDSLVRVKVYNNWGSYSSLRPI